MPKSEDRYYKRKLKSAHITTLMSITMVLFVLGLLAAIILHAQKVSQYVRENIGFTITMNKGVNEIDVIRFQKRLEVEDFVKSTKHTPVEEAAEELEKELGEDFIGFLGYNPLLPTIDVRLKASYAVSDSLKRIEQKLMRNSDVKEVDYQESMVKTINDNIEKLSIILLVFSVLLMLIAFALINNTIRLSVYSKRFLIKTMQLVGATQGFIRRPFLKQGVFYGFAGSLITIILLAGLIYFGEKQMPELLDLSHFKLYGMLAGGVIVAGLLISWVSTFFAVRKYLNIQNDKLYQ
ncbi:MAG TPA: permease-like cell division protein FtsX [Bacteroidales bacterium]|nr:permease-like cell division protein FtsX [Bacteroidales bacterium]